MKEKGFSVRHPKRALHLQGGKLWKMEDRSQTKTALRWEGDTLKIYLQPHEDLQEFFDELYALMRQHSSWLYYSFLINRQLPSLLRFIPVSLTIWGIAFITLYGEFIIGWVIDGVPDEPLPIGISRRQAFFIFGAIATALLYFFPVIITGEQESAVERLNRFFSAKRMVKRRFKLIANFLHRRTSIRKIEIWNPNFEQGEQDWVKDSLIPAFLETGKLEISLQVKLDERSTAERYCNQCLEEEVQWAEEPYVEEEINRVIPYNYLESWEKQLLALYVFASTATAPKDWQLSGSLKEGVMQNVVSLRLVELLVLKFKDRLFSEDQLKQLISMDAFASRCLNDFGILQPCLENTNDVWQLHKQVVEQELNKALEEMKFMVSYMQIDIEYLSTKLGDPISALILNAVQSQSSIYNHDRLEAIRFFVRNIQASEQYNILKQYWPLVAKHSNTDDIYRILGQELLIDLATLFERAAMYRDAEAALRYIEHIFPFKAQIGLARLAERQGDFARSEQILGEMIASYESGKIPLNKNSYLDLLLNYAWTIVSGRLAKAKEAGEAALEKLQAGLYSNYDELRNSEQMIRYYNIKANYEEWNGRPEGALQSYDQALQIPGVQRAALSNLLVNKGIALRQLQQLAEATTFGEQGVAVKVALGDADQLPIALHNLAQTYLLLAQESRQLKQAAAALEHAQHGLAIQARTGSVKKRGQLLAERLVALDMLQAAATERQGAWQDLQHWMQGEIAAGRDQSYDCKVVATELLPMLPRYEAKDLKSALGFTYLLEH